MLVETKPTGPLESRIRWILCVLVLSIPLSSGAAEDETQGFDALPESLARWYKPENKRQVWLHTMFAMRRELQAVREPSGDQDSIALRKLSRSERAPVIAVLESATWLRRSCNEF